jgi:hypothetical protein
MPFGMFFFVPVRCLLDPRPCTCPPEPPPGSFPASWTLGSRWAAGTPMLWFGCVMFGHAAHQMLHSQVSFCARMVDAVCG